MELEVISWCCEVCERACMVTSVVDVVPLKCPYSHEYPPVWERFLDDGQKTNYTIKEAAEKLRMSEAWIRKQIFEKRITHLKIGSRVFIPDSTIEGLLTDGIVEREAK